ncbi:transmembrane protein, putative [Medicago truncatula]|uniref:Transmembrane protein, putative n=1 Tax=Medicago truncatula TaxID=3880 RepID=G7I654_MEDTR|nr:transmembrane protein, putative [Medicago truncatula]
MSCFSNLMLPILARIDLNTNSVSNSPITIRSKIHPLEQKLIPLQIHLLTTIINLLLSLSFETIVFIFRSGDVNCYYDERQYHHKVDQATNSF